MDDRPRFTVRPLGSGRGCLMMLLVSLFLSVALTVILNVVLRLL